MPLTPEQRRQLLLWKMREEQEKAEQYGKEADSFIPAELVPTPDTPSSIGPAAALSYGDLTRSNRPTPDLAPSAALGESTRAAPSQKVYYPYGIAGATPVGQRLEDEEPGFLERVKADVEGIAEGGVALPGVVASLVKEVATHRGQPVTEENYPVLRAIGGGLVEHAKQRILHPIESFKQEPVSVALDVTGLLGGGAAIAGRLGRAGRIKTVGQLLTKVDNAKDIKTVLRKVGVPRAARKKYAGALAAAKTEGDVGSVLARIEKDVGISLGGPEAVIRTQEAKLGARLGKGEDLSAIHGRRMEALQDAEAGLASSLGRLTGAKEPSLSMAGEFETIIAKHNQIEASIFERAAGNIKKGSFVRRERTPEEFQTGTTIPTQQTEELLKATAQVEKLRERTKQRLAKVAGAPQGDDISIADIQKALDNYQHRVETAKSISEAELGKWQSHVPADLVDMPLVDTKGLLTDAEFMVQKSGLTNWMRKKHLSNLFGADSRILQRTQAGEAFDAAIARTWEGMERLQVEQLIPFGDAAHRLHKADPDGWRLMAEGTPMTNYRRWLESGKPRRMTMEQPGGTKAEMDVPESWVEFSGQTEPLRKTRLKQANERGLEVNDLGEGYLSRMATPETKDAFRQKIGDQWAALQDWAEKSGIPADDLESIGQLLFEGKRSMPIRKSGSLEHELLARLPDRWVHNGKTVTFLKTDPVAVWESYIVDTARRMAFVDNFGVDGKRAFDLFRAETNTQVRDVMGQMFRDIQGYSDHTSWYSHPLGQVVLGGESAARGIQLSAASLPNLTGLMWAGRKWGLTNTLRGQWQTLRATGNPNWNPSWTKAALDDLEISRLSGLWGKQSFKYQGEVESTAGEFGAAAKIMKASRLGLRATGLQLIEGNTNKVAGLAARYALEDMRLRLLRPGNKGPLARMFGMDDATAIREWKRDFRWTNDDIKRIINDGFSTEDLFTITMRAPTIINAYRRGPGDIRHWMRHPLSQRALAYTSWRLARGQMVWNAIDEFRLHGNIKPLLKEIGYGQAAGHAVTKIQDYAYNRGHEDEDWYRDIGSNMVESASAGMLGSIAESYRYTTSHGFGSKTWEVLQFPAFATLSDLVRVVRDAIVEGPEEALGTAIKKVPALRTVRGVGMRLFDPEAAEDERQDQLFKERKRKFRLRNKNVVDKTLDMDF